MQLWALAQSWGGTSEAFQQEFWGKSPSTVATWNVSDWVQSHHLFWVFGRGMWSSFPNEVRCGGESVQGHSPEDGKGVCLQRGSQHPCWAGEVQRKVQLLHKGGRSRGSTPNLVSPPGTSQHSARFTQKGPQQELLPFSFQTRAVLSLLVLIGGGEKEYDWSASFPKNLHSQAAGTVQRRYSVKTGKWNFLLG